MLGSHDKVGTARALTVFAPIIPGHEEAVRELIESLPRGEDSPLARLPQLHLSRLQIIKELEYQGGGQKRDELASSYLVFTSSFNGDENEYLDTICAVMPDEADSWWSHCVGYPGAADRAAFKRYILSHHQKTNLFASAYPNETVQDVRDALALRERMIDFVVEMQRSDDPAELRRRFLDEFAGAR